MKKKFVIITFLIIFSILILILIPNFSYAKANMNYGLVGNMKSPIANETELFMGTGINVIRNVALTVAIVMLTYMAIRYMTEGPEGRANFKKSATIYVFGAALLFGTSGIITLIQNFVKRFVRRKSI